MSKLQELLRNLPKIDQLLESDDAKAHISILGRKMVADICRDAVAEAKEAAIKTGQMPELTQITQSIKNKFKKKRSNILGKVINGTGVLLHTNMGRSPLGPDIFIEMSKAVSGYCNLEINVLERQRGIRGPSVSSLLAAACECEDAVVVNNNAAAMLIILQEFAPQKKVTISRGELIQIGGGFRIPDILATSGAILNEVGTTNITTAADFEKTAQENTAIWLKVHNSNFRMQGFVENPDIAQLSKIKKTGVLLVHDLGSGNLCRRVGQLTVDEPTPKDSLAAGADLVCFSTDKMLGGVQGGVIAGNADLVKRIRKNPLMRAIRPGKLTYAALEVVLKNHLSQKSENVMLWKLASMSQLDVKNRVMAFIRDNDLDQNKFVVVSSSATFGGGSTPEEALPSAAIRFVSNKSADTIARWFQQQEPPVVGVIHDNAFHIDFKAVLAIDEPLLSAAVVRFSKEVQ